MYLKKKSPFLKGMTLKGITEYYCFNWLIYVSFSDCLNDMREMTVYERVSDFFFCSLGWRAACAVHST